MCIEKITSLISIFGLIIDIVGVVVVFIWGLPYELPERDLYVEETITEVQLLKNKIQKRKAYSGLTLILLGFLFQLLSYLITFCNLS